MKTIADVFIIESLSPDDEGNGRFEGVMLSSILRFHGKNPIYRYVRSLKQFVRAVKDFGKSNYRYLHVSMHANKYGICTTNQDEIKIKRLATILKPHLKGRRLFVSACALVNDIFAEKIIGQTQCLSVAGPNKNIKFSDAAITWVSIYHLMFTLNARRMSHADLVEKLKSVRKIFGVRLSYYSKTKKLECGFDRLL